MNARPPVPERTDTLCPVCGASASEPALSKDGYTIVRCSLCQMLYVRPVLSADELQAYYQDPGYFHGESTQGYQSYEDLRKALVPHSWRRLRVINGLLPAKGRLLDFGCAAGYFLEVAQADGWRIAGVELSREMAGNASRALGVSIATSLEALPDRELDVITLWEVVEHLPQPLAELRRMYDRLRPGGLLMLSTPNTGHWQALCQPDAWEGYRPPAHLLFFTAGTLVALLQRAGFERITVSRVSPLPRLPCWLQRISAPLQAGLASGRASAWPLALVAWRAVRVCGWGWQRITHPRDDVFAALEATAFRPA